MHITEHFRLLRSEVTKTTGHNIRILHRRTCTIEDYQARLSTTTTTTTTILIHTIQVQKKGKTKRETIENVVIEII